MQIDSLQYSYIGGKYLYLGRLSSAMYTTTQMIITLKPLPFDSTYICITTDDIFVIKCLPQVC